MLNRNRKYKDLVKKNIMWGDQPVAHQVQSDMQSLYVHVIFESFARYKKGLSQL